MPSSDVLHLLNLGHTHTHKRTHLWLSSKSTTSSCVKFSLEAWQIHRQTYRTRGRGSKNKSDLRVQVARFSVCGGGAWFRENRYFYSPAESLPAESLPVESLPAETVRAAGEAQNIEDDLVYPGHKFISALRYA